MNERAAGAHARASKAREEIVLETKLWPSFFERPTAVDETLERLGTDYIDLMILHQPAGDTVAGYRILEKAHEEGTIRAIGLSNFDVAQTQRTSTSARSSPPSTRSSATLLPADRAQGAPGGAQRSRCRRGTHWAGAAMTRS